MLVAYSPTVNGLLLFSIYPSASLLLKLKLTPFSLCGVRHALGNHASMLL